MATRVLNVAEKPSVAKSVSQLLSGNNVRVREGRSRYNKIFEFGYTIGNQQCLMFMTSVSGHLMELEFEERFRKWNSCDPVALYEAPVRKYVPQDKQALQRTLEEEARRCQWLVLWLDCDREGENIAFEVMDVCRSANSRLNIWRAHFSALTERDVHQAAQHLGRPNQLYSDAVDARQEIDLRIGASFTRFQTILLADSFALPFEEERKPILSYGPCQFPTLGFVVERYWEVQAHVPEDFWKISCVYNDGSAVANFTWVRGHLFDYIVAAMLYEMCIEEPTASVCEVKGQERKKFPPHPLNTVELQKRASRYFRMGSEQTMKVAEELYQAGFISYPRTETDFFPGTVDLMGIIREQTGHPVWGTYAERLLDPGTNLFRQPSNGGHNDQAHPPIYPTKLSQGEQQWGNPQKQIYELVTRHFLACVSQPAVGYGTTAVIDIAGEMFRATGLMITARNYLEVYRFESWGANTIPNFEEGQQFVPSRLTLDQGTTTPPPLLSEADLISLMDKAGIGTDATMHDHIKKLLDRSYATKDANTRFCPTNLGEALVMGYDDMGYELWKPYLRAMMEQDMKAVSIGTKSKAQVLESCLQQMKTCFMDATLQKQKLLEAMGRFFERTQGGDQRVVGEFVRLCPNCQESNMVLKKKPDGKYMVGCLGFPRVRIQISAACVKCRAVVWLPGAVTEASVTTIACTSCIPGPVLKVLFKFRRAEIPPQYSTECTGCVGGCDNHLKELFEICGINNRPPPAGPAVGHGETRNRNGLGNQTSCAICGGDGHSFAACPQAQARGQGQVRNRDVRQGGERFSASARVFCNCQEVCVLLTAKTSNNGGRKFYRCATRGCDFFLWEDVAHAQAAGAQNQQVSNRQLQPGQWRTTRSRND